jgi:hypothetical protein
MTVRDASVIGSLAIFGIAWIFTLANAVVFARGYVRWQKRLSATGELPLRWFAFDAAEVRSQFVALRRVLHAPVGPASLAHDEWDLRECWHRIIIGLLAMVFLVAAAFGLSATLG